MKEHPPLEPFELDRLTARHTRFTSFEALCAVGSRFPLTLCVGPSNRHEVFCLAAAYNGRLRLRQALVWDGQVAVSRAAIEPHVAHLRRVVA